MSTDSLDAYVRDIAQFVRLPSDRERALAEVERTGRDAIDRAIAEERRQRDVAESVARGLATVEDRLRRLQGRTGQVASLPAEGVPTDLAAMSRFLEGMVRDLDSAEKAQAWVERARANLQTGAFRLGPTRSPLSGVPETLTPEQPAVPAGKGAAKQVSPTVVIVTVVLLLVIAIVVFLVTR